MSDRLRDLELGFATLSATLTTKIDALMTDGAPRHLDHENRLRKLEAKVWVAAGAALAGGGVMGTVGSYLLGL